MSDPITQEHAETAMTLLADQIVLGGFDAIHRAADPNRSANKVFDIRIPTEKEGEFLDCRETQALLAVLLPHVVIEASCQFPREEINSITKQVAEASAGNGYAPIPSAEVEQALDVLIRFVIQEGWNAQEEATKAGLAKRLRYAFSPEHAPCIERLDNAQLGGFLLGVSAFIAKPQVRFKTGEPGGCLTSDIAQRANNYLRFS